MVTVAEIEDRIAEMHNERKTSKEISKVVHIQMIIRFPSLESFLHD
jgi:hypothetical protein